MKICSICGRVGTNKHHIRQKGMGGLGKKSTPEQHETVTLCGMGNMGDYCHGLVHQHHISLSKSGDELYFTAHTQHALDVLSQRSVDVLIGEETQARFYGVDYEDLL